jgi:triosephosphate isomerase
MYVLQTYVGDKTMNLRKILIVGNWKMNKTIPEAVGNIRELRSAISDLAGGVEILVCPAFTALFAVSNEIKGSNINIGAQNIFWEQKGAFTGEVSPAMLKDIGCSYVIIGHSERRQYFLESDEIVNKKIKTAIETGLIPILCVGETLEERKSGITFKVIEKQIKNGLASLRSEEVVLLVLAYEPVWAIGTGKIATPEQAQTAHVFIRKTCAEMYGSETAERMRILYGGSVNSANISELIRKPDIDGGLVGGASLGVDSFTKIIKNANNL